MLGALCMPAHRAPCLSQMLTARDTQAHTLSPEIRKPLAAQVYVITKLGLLFVYDLTTATAVYRNRISPDPIFLTANSGTTGGFYAINKCGPHRQLSAPLTQGCGAPCCTASQGSHAAG